MSSDPNASKVRGWWFDGKVYSTADMREYTDFKLALDLAACDDEHPCALDDMMMLSCMGGYNCATDRHEYTRTHT